MIYIFKYSVIFYSNPSWIDTHWHTLDHKRLEVLTFASFSPSFLTIRTFSENLLLSPKVAADYNGASLGVSVLPLHTSLSTCN